MTLDLPLEIPLQLLDPNLLQLHDILIGQLSAPALPATFHPHIVFVHGIQKTPDLLSGHLRPIV